MSNRNRVFVIFASTLLLIVGLGLWQGTRKHESTHRTHAAVLRPPPTATPDWSTGQAFQSDAQAFGRYGQCALAAANAMLHSVDELIRAYHIQLVYSDIDYQNSPSSDTSPSRYAKALKHPDVERHTNAFNQYGDQGLRCNLNLESVYNPRLRHLAQANKNANDAIRIYAWGSFGYLFSLQHTKLLGISPTKPHVDSFIEKWQAMNSALAIHDELYANLHEYYTSEYIIPPFNPPDDRQDAALRATAEAATR